MNLQQNDMQGKVCLVTGATAGIGQATAKLLAQRGATVVGVGRNPAKNEFSTTMIKEQTGNPSVEYLLADLSSQKEIRNLAQQFQKKYDRLDILINNAGATFGERLESVDGIEMTFALNHLGYFLMTKLLSNILEASAPSRVINVSSSLHKLGKINFDDIPFQIGYVNPGLVATNVGQSAGGFSEKAKGLVDKIAGLTPEEGAQTIIYLATSPEVKDVTGRYFVKEKSVPSSKITYDLDFCQRLWAVSESLITSNGQNGDGDIYGSPRDL